MIRLGLLSWWPLWALPAIVLVDAVWRVLMGDL